jgi:hypothetical protein
MKALTAQSQSTRFDARSSAGRLVARKGSGVIRSGATSFTGCANIAPVFPSKGELNG